MDISKWKSYLTKTEGDIDDLIENQKKKNQNVCVFSVLK